MKKRVLVLLLAGMMALQLASCGGESSSNAGDEKTRGDVAGADDAEDDGDTPQMDENDAEDTRGDVAGAEDGNEEESSGNLLVVSVKASEVNSDGTQKDWQNTYEIDDHTITVYSYLNSELDKKTVYQVNDDGLVLVKTEESSEEIWRREYTYDEKTRVSRMDIYLGKTEEVIAQAKPFIVKTYSYDDTGKLSEYKRYIGGEVEFAYEGDLLTMISETENSKFVFSYNEKGYVESYDSYHKNDAGWYQSGHTEADGTMEIPLGYTYWKSHTYYDEEGNETGTESNDQFYFYVSEERIVPAS